MAHVSLEALLSDVEVGSRRGIDGLEILGLRWRAESGGPYRTLEEALGDGTLEVSEVSEAGSVPTLKVTNRGNARVFLLSGEHVVGAKQDRVLNASFMVAAGTVTPVPVSCVEARRWHDRSRSGKFGSKQTMSHGTLRKMMSKQARESYEASGAPGSDQGEVWREVNRKLAAMGSQSPTEAFAQVYDDHAARLERMVADLPAPADCQGAAFVIEGVLAGVDLFDRPETLAKLWPKLIRGHALDALERRRELERERGQSPDPQAPRVGDGPRVTSAQELVAWLRGAGARRPSHSALRAWARTSASPPRASRERPSSSTRFRSTSSSSRAEVQPGRGRG